MSKRRSRLAARRPIASTAQLGMQANLFVGKRLSNRFYREVVASDISPGRQIAVIELICGHRFLVTALHDFRCEMIWADGIPGGYDCPRCANLIEYDEVM